MGVVSPTATRTWAGSISVGGTVTLFSAEQMASGLTIRIDFAVLWGASSGGRLSQPILKSGTDAVLTAIKPGTQADDRSIAYDLLLSGGAITVQCAGDFGAPQGRYLITGTVL